MIPKNSVSVLLLEEEAIIALDVEFSLSQAGYTIAAVFSTGGKALEWLSDHSPSVVILDVQLKDGPSHRVARTLSERAIPFIVHSSICRPGADAFAAGTWVLKPCCPTELAKAIARSLHLADHPELHPGSLPEAVSASSRQMHR